MNSKNGKPVGKLLAASLLGLAGVAAWILLSAGQAGALVVSDQEATNVNVGVAVANTGGNVAVGNASDNDAGAAQVAVAAGGGDDVVASNTANTSNNSGGNASIVTGNATATGNHATNNTVQAVDGGGNGGLVIADQTANNVNVGAGIANTGLNGAVGNASQNDAGALQLALAFGGGGTDDTVALNSANASNNSTGSASIITGSATAIGNIANNNTSQVIDADDATGLVLGDQTVNNVNFGLGIANSGLNFGVGNPSNNNSGALQLALALGGGTGDSVAVNDTSATNNSTGLASIVTGSANATGNIGNNNNSQVLDGDNVAATRSGSALWLFLLAVLMGLLFVGRPKRQLGFARRRA